MRNKPLVVYDFDGVIHEYKSPFVNEWTIPDGPVDGAKESMQGFFDHGFSVAVYSSRSASFNGITAMKVWMRKNGFPVEDIEFPSSKPPAFITIDDRAYLFDGIFPDPGIIAIFRPWNKRDQTDKDLSATSEIIFPTGEVFSIPNMALVYFWAKHQDGLVSQTMNIVEQYDRGKKMLRGNPRAIIQTVMKNCCFGDLFPHMSLVYDRRMQWWAEKFSEADVKIGLPEVD